MSNNIGHAESATRPPASRRSFEYEVGTTIIKRSGENVRIKTTLYFTFFSRMLMALLRLGPGYGYTEVIFCVRISVQLRGGLHFPTNLFPIFK
jgi:hypothetical protein